MAHPDHDQVIGRLVGARLRGAADRRAVSGGAAEAHPDAEAWAAYVDGGLRADEVVRLETHLAGCPACRRLLAVLARGRVVRCRPGGAGGRGARCGARRRDPVSASSGVCLDGGRGRAPDGRDALVRVAPRRSAGLERGDVRAPAEAPAPLTVPPAPPPADAASKTSAPQSRLEDAKASIRWRARSPAAVERGVARQEQDKRKPDSRSDALALRQPAEFAAAEEKQAVQAGAAPAGNARDIQPQTNVSTAAARPRGPLANQQANQQAGNQQQYAGSRRRRRTPRLRCPRRGRAAQRPRRSRAARREPVAPPAQADAAAADTRERRANEQVSRDGDDHGVGRRRAPHAGAAPAGAEPGCRRRARGAGPVEGRSRHVQGPRLRRGRIRRCPRSPSPAGRLRWRIADGRRLESSSDGGTTWTGQFTARASAARRHGAGHRQRLGGGRARPGAALRRPRRLG